MKPTSRANRLEEQIGDAIAGIAVLVVDLRTNAEVHADVHELSLKTKRIHTPLAICWSTDSWRRLPQMSESAVGMSEWESNREKTGDREVRLFDVVVHVDKLGVLRSNGKRRAHHQALAKHLVLKDSSRQVFSEF